MIEDEAEYQSVVRILEAQRGRLGKCKAKLRKEGLTPAQLKRALDPLVSFHLGLEEEAADYRRRQPPERAPESKKKRYPRPSNHRGLGAEDENEVGIWTKKHEALCRWLLLWPQP